MVVRLYGTRGSIAVANKDVRKYGGNTTCLYVESNSGEAIVIDAGTGIRGLGRHLMQNEKDKIHLIFTHYHWDHIQGFPFFAPIFFKNVVIKIYGPAKEPTAEKALIYQMTSPYFPAAMDSLPGKIMFRQIKKRLNIGSIEIKTITNNHPNYTLGLRFTEERKSFVLLTDNELLADDGKTPYKKFVDFVKGANFFIHDAQYTDDVYKEKSGWGHSTHNQVMQLAKDAGVRKVLFTHHDPESTDQCLDKIVKGVRRKYPKYNIQAAAEGKTITLK